MLHLFNSCYVYPDVTFNPSSPFVVVGENSHIYGSNLDNSFFYSNVATKPCLGRYKTYEDLVFSSAFKSLLESKNKIIIYADDTEYIKFFAGVLKTHVTKMTPQFFLDACKIESVRLKTRAKLIDNVGIVASYNRLANKFYDLDAIPERSYPFQLEPKWVIDNGGIEWKLMNGKLGNVDDLIKRYVYSYYEEAKAKFLSRKEPSGWVIDPDNAKYETVKDMAALYNEMRKEVAVFTDSLILEYFSTGNVESIVSNPMFLMLISANKNMPDKINIWLTRYVMKMSRDEIIKLGILS